MRSFKTDIILDLHGCTGDEAVGKVRETCRQNPGRSLMVIHGCGQGILRERVRAWAGETAMVKRVMPGEDCFLPGGSGVTVLYLLALVLIVFASFGPGVCRAGVEEPKASATDKAVFLVDVTLPIDGRRIQIIRESIGNYLRTPATVRSLPKSGEIALVFRFNAPGTIQEMTATTFGDAFEFARLLREKKFMPESNRKFTTTALVTMPLSGHILLPVLTCDELVLANDASLGPVVQQGDTITPAMRTAYTDFCRQRCPGVVLNALLRPETRIYELETEKGTQWLGQDEFDTFNKAKKVALAIPRELVFPKGRGVFVAEELRRFGIAGMLVSGKTALIDFASALGRTPNEIRDIIILDAFHCAHVSLFGPISSGKVDEIQRMILKAIDENKLNCLILQIDSAGGSLSDSIRFANWLVRDIASRHVHLIAYVPTEARSDALLIALSCDVVFTGPDAVLGGLGLGHPDDTALDNARETLEKCWSEASGKSWSLPLASIDSRLEVYHYVHRQSGRDAWFCERELKGQIAPDDWIRKELVSPAGSFMALTGRNAVDFNLATQNVANMRQLREFYGIAGEPFPLEPHWVDHFIRFISSPVTTMTLLVLGFVFLYIELNTPGFGLAFGASMFCFIIFFWASCLGGTAGWLEIVLFGFGFVCLVLEIVVIPGFGIVGIVGCALVILSFVLASQTFIIPQNAYEWGQFQKTLMVFLLSCVGFTVAAYFGTKTLARKFVPDDDHVVAERERIARFDSLVGVRGVTTSRLMPSGKAILDGKIVSVISESGLPVDNGATIEVVAVCGSRIAVKPVDADA